MIAHGCSARDKLAVFSHTLTMAQIPWCFPKHPHRAKYSDRHLLAFASHVGDLVLLAEQGIAQCGRLGGRRHQHLGFQRPLELAP